ncbi:MAG TPA: fused MFS/spermidine synthase [Vicinamibacterales bacterium]|nr:fused MFS/spermidine synthase [Vicinamibacterales bacterium]
MLPRLAVLFFLSGACALIYQVLWLRQLSLIFGVTVYAASTVLATFMAGLAIGSAAAGRLSERVRRPLLWFGAAEALIGVTALLSPLALDLVTAGYVALAPGLESRALATALRFACSAAVLLVPTVLMGATLPLVLQSSVIDAPGVAARLSLLYGINTAGAVAGCLLAGFVLIGGLGISATSRIAASVNVAIGAAAIVMARRTLAEARDVAQDDGLNQDREAAAPFPARSLIFAAFVLSGLASLALEVVWFRSLVLYYPATTYAFTAMLAAVLIGIAAGSLVAAPILRRRAPSLWAFGALHAAAGIAAVAGAQVHGSLYEPASAASGLMRGTAIAVLPTSLCLGMAFPVGVRLWSGRARSAGRQLGVLYAGNVAGALVGSLLAGFVLLAQFGSARSLLLMAGVSLTTGILLLIRDIRRAPLISSVVAVLAIGAFASLADDTPDPFTTGLTRRYPAAGHVFMRDEGVQTTVSVHMREIGGRQLYLDGLHQASDGRDVVMLHRQIGHLPVLLHPRPVRALVIGLGGGATAGAVSLHPGLDVDLVELASGVVKGASWFSHINENVLSRPNVRLHVDDARNHLLLGRSRYDVITADVIQPTHAGAGMLYSREYFTLARRALTDSGVMVQWIGLRSRLHYELIARTFLQVFPETSVWVNGSLLIGSIRPLDIEEAELAERFAAAALQPSLAAAGFRDPESLLGHYVASPEDLRRFIGAGPILTDDKPLLEYYLSLPEDDRPLDLSGLRRSSLLR